jgi:hypothetical protein
VARASAGREVGVTITNDRVQSPPVQTGREVRPPAPPGPSDPFPFRTLDELAREKPRPWLVPDVIARGDLVLIWGAPKSGKTLLATSLAVHAAAGGKWFTARAPAKDTPPVRVAYIAAEGAARDRFDQAMAVLKSMKDPPPGAVDRVCNATRVLPRPVDLGDLRQLNLLREAARKAYDGAEPDLWIFDTLSRCAAGREENSASDMSAVVDAITQALLHPSRHGERAAVLLIHHGTKDDKHERGSSVFRGAWDREIKVVRLNGKKGKGKEGEPDEDDSGDAKGNQIKVSCPSTRTTDFPTFIARIEAVPTVDFDDEGNGPIRDFDGSPVMTACAVEDNEPQGGQRRSEGQERGAGPADEEVDRVGPIVAELVRRHFDGRAPSQNKLLNLVKDTRDDHGLRRDRVVACIPGMLERAWLHKGKPGRSGGCELLAGSGPGQATAPNGASLFDEARRDLADDSRREVH